LELYLLAVWWVLKKVDLQMHLYNTLLVPQDYGSPDVNPEGRLAHYRVGWNIGFGLKGLIYTGIALCVLDERKRSRIVE
jgi:hypothetical protein